MAGGEDYSYEAFNVDDTYEGGQWINGEFYYAKEKQKRKFTKDDAIFGIFVGDSSDEEGGSRKKSRYDKSYAKPVQFISTGETMGGDSKKKKKEDSGDDSQQDDEDADVMTAGLGSNKKKKKKKKEKPAIDIPSSFGKSKKKSNWVASSRQQQEDTQPVADFERYTKGIGSKLLKAMGYSGGGLGKEGKGIAAPIEVKMRPKGMGLSYGDFDSKTKQDDRKQKMEESEEEESDESEEESEEEKEKGWKKGAQVRRKPKTVYEVLEEVEETKPQLIVDMRGPQARVLPSMAEAARGSERASGPLPELRHNIRLLVDLAEVNIQNLDRKQKAEKENIARWNNEKDKLERQIKIEADQIQRIQEVLEILAKCQERVQTGDMPLSSMIKVFDLLQHKYHQEYVMYKMKFLALEFVEPLIKSHMEMWNPLIQPSYGIDIFQAWKGILQEDSMDFGELPPNLRQQGDVDIYLQLVHDVLMPKIRTFLSNQWQPRNPEPVLALLEAWQSVLPPALLESILTQLVLPKLHYEVDAWNPRTDTIPIHAWLHPWLPWLGQRMDPLYAPIRHKLSIVLQEWHPSDPSAHAILAPWQKVFDPSSMEALLVRCIVPKLIFALREFIINPMQQYLEPFQWVMLWEDLIPQHHFVALLEAEFFPKWLNVLYAWLASRPDYDEVSRWYLGWKKMFSADLISNDRIRAYFNMALEAMNKSISGGLPSYTYQMPPPPPPTMTMPPPPPPPQEPMRNGTDELSLKQMVEALAAENDFMFLPTKRRAENGQLIYTFGNVPVYLDKGVVFVAEDRAWKPTSPDLLIAKAKSAR
jgi:tuftelin-interacting protein 11